MGLFDSDKVGSTGQIATDAGMYVTRTRVEKIQDLLDSDELVHYLALVRSLTRIEDGDRTRVSEPGGRIRAAVTDKRLVLSVPKGIRDEECSIPYESITALDLDSRTSQSRLTVTTGDESYELTIDRPESHEIRELLRFMQEQCAAASDDPVDASSNERDSTGAT